jgi:hypothetical protein
MLSVTLDMCKAWIIYMSIHVRLWKNMCKGAVHSLYNARL